ncbi:polyprenyl synthetase family protein [Neorhizobium sp. NPDC001467]|uniref:polyprenyl synthetase family protein n=1 Tax=Neorhizobium sp. NPDC001467 TaxID=3390595 RepID=UPI003CFD280E
MSCTRAEISLLNDEHKKSDRYTALSSRENTNTDCRLVIEKLKSRIEDRLHALLELGEYTPPRLVGAMRHALLGGGKRFRPLLLVLSVPQDDHLDAAIDMGCAVEMVHTASLILDDLPCMDDAQMRRDKQTTHVVYGQATAILAAISLLTRGMNVLSNLEGVPPHVRARLVAILSHAVGHTGLAAGQEIDLSDGTDLGVGVEEKNWLKTGRLFAAMAEMASVLDNRSAERAAALSKFAFHVGSAFQALDDLLDTLATENALGKDVRKDVGKSSMMSVNGETVTRHIYLDHLESADLTLGRCGVDEEPIRLMLRSIEGLVPSGPLTV